MADLYPLKFEPQFIEKIWGGRKLQSQLNKNLPPEELIGESWEISGVKDHVSIVRNGSLKGRSLTDLISEMGTELLGQKVMEKYKADFPLLIKFLDAQEDLSIQVHPNDALAKQRHNSFGKSEMWYILQADQGASLISGFSKKVNPEDYLAALESKKLDAILNKELTVAGDVFNIPAGRVHTIGKGLLLAEIQQSSDITYRIYDFDRPDKDGNLRELHTEEALDAIDFEVHDNYKTDYNNLKNESVSLVQSPYFSTNKYIVDKPIHLDWANDDSFHILIATSGSGTITGDFEDCNFFMGDAVLIPAGISKVLVACNESLEFLETYIP